ncbi:MAG: septum site-determining protein MinD [Eubacteriales bacterium]|nr:septum site-determining protein MinD [Eubacteriales bacterium]
MGKVFLVASGKGGTGKTMFAVNLGATFALMGRSVCIVDMDMGLRNVDLYMGIQNDVVFDAYDVMKGMCRIKQALVRDRRFDALYVMGASPEKFGQDITPLHAKVLCDKLKEAFDIVIVDAPAGIEDGFVISAAGADTAVIVTTADYASLRDADAVDRALMGLGIYDRYVVINRLKPEHMNGGYIPKLHEIVPMLRPEILGIIQDDDNIMISTEVGIPIVLKRDTYISGNFDTIAGKLEADEK